MSLSTEDIKKNTKTFFATGEKYNFTNDKLVELIGDKLMTAPATMTSEGYNSFEGGLIAHIIDLTGHALKINELLPEEKRANKESLIKVCFLHQIGKANMFVKRDSQWHIDRGMFYQFNEETPALTVAQWSTEFLTRANLIGELTEAERMAIMIIPTEFGNRKLNDDSERIAAVVKAATLTAIIQEK
jgi:hypothetical protein